MIFVSRRESSSHACASSHREISTEDRLLLVQYERAEDCRRVGEKVQRRKNRDERRVWPSPRGWLSSLCHITTANVSHGLLGCDCGAETRNRALGMGHSKHLSISITFHVHRLSATVADSRENRNQKFKKRKKNIHLKIYRFVFLFLIKIQNLVNGMFLLRNEIYETLTKCTSC